MKAGKQSQLVWLVALFGLALLPRLVYPVTWPLQWYSRSVAFYDALADGRFEDTFQQQHPGVTTMWVAGLGLRIFAALEGWSADDLANPPVNDEHIRDFPEEPAVAALAVFISLGIVLATLLLIRLWGQRAGWLGGVLLALDPFLLTYSKVLHVDAMMAILMILSALFLFVYLREQRRELLWLSGLFGGLALLSKTPSVFLLPFTALTLFGGNLLDRPGRASWQRLGDSLSLVVQWALVAGFTFILFWPAMWVAPVETLTAIWQGINKHVQNPHAYNFFAGRIIAGDAGLLFYPATIAWKSTFLTLPGALIAAVLTIRRCWRRNAERAALWLLVYVLAFMLMMSLAAGKETRYLLPVFPALDLLAAWGIVTLGEKLAQRSAAARRWLPAVLVLLLAGQGVAVLRNHPYYGVHHNLLLGGTPVAVRVLPLCDQGEGIEKAAEFLNQLPGAELLTAGAPERFHHLFYRHFRGAARLQDGTPVDYMVFAINSTQREADNRAYQRFVQEHPGVEPVWSLEQDGVTLVTIYAAYPQDLQDFAITNPLAVELGDEIGLLGYELAPDRPVLGQSLALTLTWQLDRPVAQDLHVFVHLLDENGGIVAQADGVPQGGSRPTWSWQPGEVLQDSYQLAVPAELDSGRYRLLAGMYDYGTKVRLPAVARDGVRYADDAVALAEFEFGG